MQAENARHAMNRMYRHTRHIYDATRKYYLLGRDVLIRELKPAAGDHICEIGCGTARNLTRLAKLYPQARFYGLDASDEMLKTARQALVKVQTEVTLAQGFAQSFDPAALFGVSAFDKVVFSYALSIIPPWRESIDHALEILKPGGEIHIIDFGPQDGLPGSFRRGLYWWLDKFHVQYRPELLPYMKQLEETGKGRLTVFESLYKGYAQRMVFTRA